MTASQHPRLRVPIRLGINCCLLAILAACSTLDRKSEKTVVGSVGSAHGQWVGSAEILNLKSKKSGTIEFEAIGEEPAKLHLEAVGPFGVAVASIAMNGDQFQILLPREKKYYAGKTSSHSLARLIPIHLSPELLMAIFFDRELPAPWNCKKSVIEKEGPTSDCSDATTQSHMERKSLSQGRRKILYASPEARVTMIVKEAKAKVEPGESAYTLAPPPPDFRLEAL